MVDKVKRTSAPQYPAMIKYSESGSIMIIDFLNHFQDDIDGNEEYHSFASVAISKDMAKNIIVNLYSFINSSEEDEGVEEDNK
ncbi:hypothetical protein ACT2VT_002759 [Pantoea agglomerans]